LLSATYYFSLLFSTVAHSSIFLFTGANTFLLEQEYHLWKKRFLEKHGEDNFLELSAKNCTADQILDSVSFPPFLAEKRLVTIDGIPRLEREFFDVLVRTISADTVLLFRESAPDKRLSFTKLLLEHATVKTFAPLSPAALRTWMTTLCAERGSHIAPDAIDALLSIAGNDQWTLFHELEKLTCASTDISRVLVEEMVAPSGEQVIWALTDLLGKGDALSALAFIRRRFDRGEEVYGVWSLLISFVKNVTLVHSLLRSNVPANPTIIAEKTGVPFFGVRGLLPLAQALSSAQIETIVEWVAEQDLALKTGGIQYSASHEEEVLLLVERCILLLSVQK
jgi:DNA polymerase III subunit delta